MVQYNRSWDSIFVPYKDIKTVRRKRRSLLDSAICLFTVVEEFACFFFSMVNYTKKHGICLNMFRDIVFPL